MLQRDADQLLVEEVERERPQPILLGQLGVGGAQPVADDVLPADFGERSAVLDVDLGVLGSRIEDQLADRNPPRRPSTRAPLRR